MTSEVGSGQVAIFPTFKGFRRAVDTEVGGSAKSASKGFGRVLDKAGTSVGRSTGQGFKKAFEVSASSTGAAVAKKIQSEIASVSKALSASRLKEQEAAGKVRIAEAALAEARKKGVAGSARLITAEERLATATRNLDAAQDTTRKSSEQLRDAQKRLADATVQGNERSATSARLLLSSSLRRGLNFGATAGANFGLGFLGSFRKAVAPIAAIAAGYLGLAAAGRVFRGFTGFVRDSVAALGDWQVLNAQSGAVVRSTGGIARVTAGRIHELSLSIEETTATQAEQIQQGANLVATFKNIRNGAGKSNKIFDQTVLASVNMARALGKDVPSAAMMLSKALNDPAAGITKLTRAGVTFTDQQKDQIKALVAAGDTMQAQKIILREVNSEFGESGKAFATTLPGQVYIYNDALGDVGETIATGLTPSLSKFLDFATKGLNQLNESDFLKTFTSRLGGLVSTATDKLGQVVGLVSRLSKTGEGVTFGGVVKGLQDIFPKLEPFLGVLGIVGPALSELLKAVGPQLSDALVKLAPPIADLLIALIPLLDPLIRLVTAIVPGLVKGLEFLIPILVWLVSGAADVQDAFASIVEFFSGETTFEELVGKLKAVAAAGGGLIQALTSFGTFLGTEFAAGQAAISKFTTDSQRRLEAVAGFFTNLPVTIGIALGKLGGFLFSGGRSLIGRFVDGIRSAVGTVTGVVDDVMKRVRDFFPNSPAKRGPFSGAGWSGLKDSGTAIADQFSAGFDAAAPALGMKLSAALDASGVSESVGAGSSTQGASTGDRSIIMDGSIVGVLRELADGRARLILNQELTSMARDQLAGGLT